MLVMLLGSVYPRRPWVVLVDFLGAHVGLSMLMEEHSSLVRVIGLVIFLVGLLFGAIGITVIARSPAIGRIRYLWLALFVALGMMYVVFARGHAPQLILGVAVVAGTLMAATSRRT